ncbi:MAG: polysaccharide deacetylase family protein [Bacteroidales bacterium]|nr:polysaccharide deacetylase family protein [Bacteroidales bacterium]
MNILTIDVEEWFQFFEDLDKGEKYKNYEVRIYENVDRILGLLEENNIKATFFVVGWIAKRYPDIVKRISENFEIGSHTMTHKLVRSLNKKEFYNEVYSSVSLIEDLTSKKVRAFRAPGFSIGKNELWAFEVLSDLGFEIDSSFLPYNFGLNISKISPCIIEYNGIKIKEFPINYKSVLSKGIIFSGGGYFRFFPYKLLNYWIKDLDYFLAYIHPRDLDSKQPIIKGLSPIQFFRSYYGLKSSESKFQRLIKDNDFIDMDLAEKLIDWGKVDIIKFD